MRGRTRAFAAAVAAVAAAGMLLLLADGRGGEERAYLPDDIVMGEWEAPYLNCLDGVNPQVCIRRLVATATGQQEFGAALAMLRSGIEASPELVSACHALAHDVGEGVVGAGISLDEAYAVLWPHCAEGYYHGVLWEYAKDMDEVTLRQEKERLCEPFGPVGSVPAQGCAHLLGHLVLYTQDLDIGDSFRECATFTEQIMQLHCADGVMMEAVDQARAETDFEGLDIPKDPEAWRALFGDADQFPQVIIDECRAAPETMTVPCLIGIPNALAVLWEYDFERVGSFCSGLPAGREQDMCFSGIAVAGFNHFSWDPDLLAGACYAYPHPGNGLCISNAGEALAQHYGVFDPAARICYAAEEQHLNDCLEAVRRGVERNTASRTARE